MAARFALILAATCACGRVAFDGTPSDGGVIDGTLGDGGITSRIAYLKASNSETFDFFGGAVAISADAKTIAVGAVGEDSDVGGIDGNQTSNAASQSGAAYIFVRSGATWVQEAYVKASNPDPDDRFGEALALSADGATLAVGARQEDSSATGVGGSQASNAAPEAGAVYVFSRGNTWSQQAYLKASNTNSDDQFGFSVALSLDGNTLAVGAPAEASAATGIDGDAANNTAGSAGAVYVFTRLGPTWLQQAYIKASNTDAGDNFGYAVALSPDGNTLAVTARGEASGSPTNQADNTQGSAGAVYVFTRAGAVWSQQAYLKGNPAISGDFFGNSIALADDVLLVGAPGEDTVANSGAASLFTRSGTTWTLAARFKASNADADDQFGVSVAFTGARFLVGTPLEDSAAIGFNGNQFDNTALNSGALYAFDRTPPFAQTTYAKAPNTTIGDGFGYGLAASPLGIACGAYLEDGGSTGVDGNIADRSKPDSGAVFVQYVP